MNHEERANYFAWLLAAFITFLFGIPLLLWVVYGRVN